MKNTESLGMLENSEPIFKKEFIKWLLAALGGLIVLCVSFYFTTNSRLNDHEQKLQMLSIEKASSKDIDYLIKRTDEQGQDIRDLKANSQRIYEILLEKEKK